MTISGVKPETTGLIKPGLSTMARDVYRDEAISGSQSDSYKDYIREISDPKVTEADRLNTILDNHCDDLRKLGINEPTVQSFRQALEYELKLWRNAR
jgi:hypothetical protein